MDIGPSPNKKFSNKYQAGALSLSLFLMEKIQLTRYFNQNINKLNDLSKSSAVHNVLVIMIIHPVNLKNSNLETEIKDGLKITNKKIINEKTIGKLMQLMTDIEKI